MTSSGNANKSLLALPNQASDLSSAGGFAAMASYTHMDMIVQSACRLPALEVTERTRNPIQVRFIRKANSGASTQPITKRLAEYLSGYLEALPVDTPWLFPSATSASGHTTDIRKPFFRAVIAAGLDPVKVARHTLRQTAITQLGFTNVDIPTMQKLSRHKSLKMLLPYMHANSAHVKGALDKLDARYTAEG